MVKDVLERRQKGACVSLEYFARATWCEKKAQKQKQQIKYI